jgi:hypothetical protein
MFHNYIGTTVEVMRSAGCGFVFYAEIVEI